MSALLKVSATGAGLGIFQRVQEVHGYVYHHCQSEGHIPTFGCHLTQVSSQVRFRGKNASCELCIFTHMFTQMHYLVQDVPSAALHVVQLETGREHAQ